MDRILIALIAYAAACLVHHAHNAHFLDAYPNMPAWLSPAGVYLAWLLATAVGAAGYALVRSGYRALGITGLVAPLSAHSLAMNATIWLEAGMALALLWTVLSSRSARSSH